MMITNLPQPNKYDLKLLQQWLVRPGMGNCSFVGADRHIYNDKNAAGLATLAPHRGEVDIFTRALVTLLPNLYHWVVVRPFHHVCGLWIKVSQESRLAQFSSNADFLET